MKFVLQHPYYSSATKEVLRISELRDLVAQAVLKNSMMSPNFGRLRDLSHLAQTSKKFYWSVVEVIRQHWPIRIIERRPRFSDPEDNVYIIEIVDGRFGAGISLEEWNPELDEETFIVGDEPPEIELHLSTDLNILGTLFEEGYRFHRLAAPFQQVVQMNVTSLHLVADTCPLAMLLELPALRNLYLRPQIVNQMTVYCPDDWGNSLPTIPDDETPFSLRDFTSINADAVVGVLLALSPTIFRSLLTLDIRTRPASRDLRFLKDVAAAVPAHLICSRVEVCLDHLGMLFIYEGKTVILIGRTALCQLAPKVAPAVFKPFHDVRLWVSARAFLNPDVWPVWNVTDSEMYSVSNMSALYVSIIVNQEEQVDKIGDGQSPGWRIFETFLKPERTPYLKRVEVKVYLTGLDHSFGQKIVGALERSWPILDGDVRHIKVCISSFYIDQAD